MTTVDFFSQDEDRCAGCHLEFDEGEKIMVAMEKDWHPHCFRCYNCAKEFELDSSGERVFAMHKCKDGIDRPMHAACSQSYLDQLTKKTVRGGWKKETSFDNHIAKECAACAKEVKGQAKNIPWEGKLLHYHLTCFKCAKCGEGMRDNDRFHKDPKYNRPVCQTCGGSWTPVDK